MGCLGYKGMDENGAKQAYAGSQYGSKENDNVENER